ncbi:cytochrome P450 [Dendrothele bispora CBS 962.96]|uniref:Cytochrome P450 n=1 Tax=Dendrothele bispora (strain CBS 962.96) TaxID=1314807 RepID=A0A4S8LEM7_DENBC|nr:cytochrome P450 [Dendrothele bispora CBS 962.96]
MSDSSTLLPVLASLCALFVVSRLWNVRMEMAKLDAIPTVGSNGFWSSLWAGIYYIKHAREVVQEGYDKYYGRAFKVRLPDRWTVVATGPTMINDIKKAPDDMLSFDEAVNESLQIDYTIGKAHRMHLYHVNVVRNNLTRNIATRFSDVRDEIMVSFAEQIPVTEDWVSMPALNTIMNIVCRTTNRLFVGLPLCREPDWIDLNIQFTIKVFTSASIINLFPSVLKPIIGTLLSPRARATRRARRHIGHVIQQRMDQEDQYGKDWADKPNDLISWLLDENPGGEYRTVDDLLMRLLNINMAAIHTTSMSFSQVLYWLAVQPDHVIKELREEIESVTEEYGWWNKISMGYLRKVDSFMKEVARYTGIGEVSSDRKVLKDFTFTDGTRVPAGSIITIPAFAMHHDERHYDDPDQFKPFRFSEMRDSEGGSIKHQMITPNQDYFFFGTGRHACPGRFFAVNELKTLVAHTLLTYDVKLEGDSKVIPDPVLFVNAVLPNQEAKVMFRKRRV